MAEKKAAARATRGHVTPLRPVGNTVSRSMLETLDTLKQCALNGDVTGFVFCAAMRGGLYTTGIHGTCAVNATHARGMLMTLSDRLADEVGSRDPSEIR